MTAAGPDNVRVQNDQSRLPVGSRYAGRVGFLGAGRRKGGGDWACAPDIGAGRRMIFVLSTIQVRTTWG
jgi:hypothetical protein